MTEVWHVVVVGSLLVVFGLLVRVLIVRFQGLRLTDWLGYIVCVGGLVSVPLRLWDSSPWMLWALPVIAAYAAVQARRTLLAWRRGDTVRGFFTVGRPTGGVVDHFGARAG